MDLRDDDGYRSESLLLKIIGLIYPQSFEVVLKPGKECYYVSYNYLKVNFDNKDGSIKEGTRLDLDLPKTTINTMFRDQCGSRKYKILRIERV